MSVDYYEIDAAGVEKPMLRQMCFAPSMRDKVYTSAGYVPHVWPVVIRYEMKVNGIVSAPKLADSDVKAWDQFLHSMFNTSVTHAFTSDLKTGADGKMTVSYRLTTVDMPRIRALVYLTAMRYPDEFPAMIGPVISATGIDAQFAALRAIHTGSKTVYIGGHHLMNPAGEGATVRKATLSDFRRNLTLPIARVFDHFTVPIASVASAPSV